MQSLKPCKYKDKKCRECGQPVSKGDMIETKHGEVVGYDGFIICSGCSGGEKQ